MEMKGKTVIVTGASRGIGKQAAIAFGQLGADVVVAARTVEPRRSLPGTVNETVEAIEAAGALALAVAADMANPDDLALIVKATLDRFGRIDVLLNNAANTAGRDWGAPLLELSRESWMAQYAVNLHAPYTLMRSVAPIMAAQGGGRIINITTGRHTGTDVAAAGLATPLAYPSSKAALDQLCASLAPQLKEMGISVVNLNPGFVRTEMVDLMVERGVDASMSISMDVPARAIIHLATCDDPFTYSGKVVEAGPLLAQLG